MGVTYRNTVIHIIYVVKKIEGDLRYTGLPRGPNNCMFWAMLEAEGEVGRP